MAHLQTLVEPVNNKALVICLGMRRSGSTLQYNVARNLIEGQDAGVSIGYSPNARELCDRLRQVESYREYVLAKAHHLDLGVLRAWNGRTYILYTYRDLRDVFASGRMKWGWTLEEFELGIRRQLALYYELKMRHDVLWQKYEDLISDLERGVRDVAEFIGLRVSGTEIARVKERNTVEAALREINSSFTLRQRANSIVNKCLRMLPSLPKDLARRVRLTSKLRADFLPSGVMSKDSLLHLDHISKYKGRPGCWSSLLKEHEVKWLNENFRHWLESNGYLKAR